MAEILLIGKPNEILKDLHKYLSGYFHVQLSTDDPGIVEGILGMMRPDLIVVSLVGINNINPKLFRLLERKCANTSVITIGTNYEWQCLLRHYDQKNFMNLIRPIENSDVLFAIQDRLGLDRKGEKKNKKKKILVVDDNGATLRMLKGMLENDFEIMLAASGTKAVAIIGRDKPDLILLDYDMPVCDGKQTLEMIRSEDEMADIPVIFLTSVKDKEHIQAVLSLNPAGYLLKPPNRHLLVTEIKKVLGLF